MQGSKCTIDSKHTAPISKILHHFCQNSCKINYFVPSIWKYYAVPDSRMHSVFWSKQLLYTTSSFCKYVCTNMWMLPNIWCHANYVISFQHAGSRQRAFGILKQLHYLFCKVKMQFELVQLWFDARPPLIYICRNGI